MSEIPADPEHGWPAMIHRTAVAIFRRRDMAEELCGEFNKPLGFIASERELLAAA